MKRTSGFLMFVLIVQLIPGASATANCTIGVANGFVSSDERPLLWKSRMWTGGDNQIVYSPGSPYDYIGVQTVGATYAMMGLNSAGLSTGNSLAYTRDNGSFMHHILRNFSTLDEVREYIEEEFQAGTLDATGCFPFADAAGNASMFEISYSDWYIEYDTLDEDRLPQGVYGWVVRANEFHENEDGTDDLDTPGRYQTALHNTGGLIEEGLLSAGTIMHGNDGATGYEFMRYGPGRPLPTIAEPSVCSSMAVHGVSPDEDPALSTMWVALGQANYAIAVPTWVHVTEIPACLSSTDMAARANSLFAAGNETITQASVFPVEEHLFQQVEQLLFRWRLSLDLALRDMARVETRMAEDAYSLLYCLDLVQYDNKAPTVTITITPQARSYVQLSGQSVAIDNLEVRLPPDYRYEDDFSTEKAMEDSYDHSIFWPEMAFPPPEPYLFYTCLVQPPEALAFAGYFDMPAHLAYRFPLDWADTPGLDDEDDGSTDAAVKRGIMELDVYDLGNGYASYSLSGDGVHWTFPMPLGFGHRKIPLVASHSHTRRFVATAEDEDGTIEEIFWEFGDGDTATGASVWHTYAASGWYLVSCTVTDDDGVSVTAWQYCYVPPSYVDPDVCLFQHEFEDGAHTYPSVSDDSR